jgi:hypothetical protein
MNKMMLAGEDALFRSVTNPCVQQGLLVHSAEPSNFDNLPHVEIATHRCERQFYEW